MTTLDPRSRWRKSSFSGTSGGGDCVEVALAPRNVTVRDSKSASGAVLDFPASGWNLLLARLGRAA